MPSLSFHALDLNVKVTARSNDICDSVIFPIPLTGQFWHINSNVYTSYRGGCEDPDVDLDLKVTVTQRQRSKQALEDDLRLWSSNRALITSVTDLTRLVLS